MIEPRLYGQIAGMFRRMARGKGSRIVLDVDTGVATLMEGAPHEESQVKDPMPIEADIRPLLDGSGIAHPDPVMVVNAKARNPLWHREDDELGRQRNEEPGVRFVVNASSFMSPEQTVAGRCWWGSFDEAVAAARAFQSEHPVEHIPGGYGRVFVDVRQSHSYAPFDGTSLGSDSPILSWEVFQDRVIMVAGNFGPTTEQRETALALEQRGRVGFA